jgi:hypothetical protein
MATVYYWEEASRWEVILEIAVGVRLGMTITAGKVGGGNGLKLLRGF